MDKVVRCLVALLILIIASLTFVILYNAYVTGAYDSSFMTTYGYSVEVTTDSALTEITLFIPVPDNTVGYSPVVYAIGSKEISEIPAGWTTALYDAGGATFLKITAPAILPLGENEENLHSEGFKVEIISKSPADTSYPQEGGSVFRPVLDIKETFCSPGACGEEGWAAPAECFNYTTYIYADYRAASSAIVLIESSLNVHSEWVIFTPGYSGYQNSISAQLHGGTKGWVRTEGYLETGKGAAPLMGPPTLLS